MPCPRCEHLYHIELREMAREAADFLDAGASKIFELAKHAEEAERIDNGLFTVSDALRGWINPLRDEARAISKVGARPRHDSKYDVGHDGIYLLPSERDLTIVPPAEPTEEQLPLVSSRDYSLTDKITDALIDVSTAALQELARGLGVNFTSMLDYGDRAEPWREYMIRLICLRIEEIEAP